MSAQTIYERPEQVRGHWFIRLRSGRMIGFWDAIANVRAANSSFSTGFSRAVKLAEKMLDQEDPDLRGYYLEEAERELEKMESYLAAAREGIEKLRGDQSVQERIALLRNVAGRTPEEAASYLAKAEQLEAGLRGRRGAAP